MATSQTDQQERKRFQAIMDMKTKPIVLTQEQAELYRRIVSQRCPLLAHPLPIEE